MAGNALDMSAPGLNEAVASVRSDTTDDMYCIFTYEGKNKIILKELGKGSIADMVDSLEDSAISYVLLRVEGGRDQESKSVKFCYVVYVGPAVGGLARGRVSSHKSDLKSIIGWTVVDIQTDDKDDLKEDVIREKLKKASGANYDLGSNAGGQYESQAGSIKNAAASNYKTLEKDTNIGPVQFEKFARPKETPMDLGGRPMVAPPTAAKANTVVRDEKAIGRSKVESKEAEMVALQKKVADLKSSGASAAVVAEAEAEKAQVEAEAEEAKAEAKAEAAVEAAAAATEAALEEPAAAPEEPAEEPAAAPEEPAAAPEEPAAEEPAPAAEEPAPEAPAPAAE